MASAAASKAGPRLAEVAGRAKRRRFGSWVFAGMFFNLVSESIQGLKPCSFLRGDSAFFLPFWAGSNFALPPTAFAVGCILAPLRGWMRDHVKTSQLAPTFGLPRPAWRRGRWADGAKSLAAGSDWCRRCP